jgi:hypothetical protein
MNIWSYANGALPQHKAQETGNAQNEKSGKRVKYNERSIAAVVNKKIDAELKAAQDTHSQTAEADTFITSCLQKFANGDLTPKKPTVSATKSDAKATSTHILNSILGRAKNPSTQG